MLNAAVAALACLCLARTALADSYPLRTFQNPHSIKELATILTNIEEKLRSLDIISAVQSKQSRRLEVLQDKLDRLETTVSLKLERAQLAADRLEHRLHMLQTNVQATLNVNTEKMLQSELKISEIAQNLTNDIDGHRRILEKVNGAYAETWHRSLLLENMMRDGLSVVNATRRELADGLRGLARRQKSTNNADLQTSFKRQLNDNTYMIDNKLQKILEEQKRFIDSCQRVQQDDPTHVADVLDKLIDSLINKTASTFKELQNIQTTVRSHDVKVMRLLTARPTTQVDTTCKRLENTFKNMSPFKETELQQLTEKFVALTDRADSALQRLEAKMASMVTVAPAADEDGHTSSEITAEADKLFLKLKGIKNEYEEEDLPWDEYNNPKYRNVFYDDEDVNSDLMGKDRDILGVRKGRQITSATPVTSKPRLAAPTSPLHRRHLHKHPYDRGPKHAPPK